jgi:hypothetical protein
MIATTMAMMMVMTTVKTMAAMAVTVNDILVVQLGYFIQPI